MKIRYRHAKAAIFGALLLNICGGVFAKALEENQADIQQAINIPGMNITLNAGGTGCNTSRHEKWELTESGCSNIEWVKQTAWVFSVTATPSTILANNIQTTTLVATLKDGDGYLVGPGISTNWGTSRGSLSATSTVTNASGETVVTLRGTVAGVAKVTAAAIAGSAYADVTLVGDPSTSTVVSLTPNPASVNSNGEVAGLYASVRDAYNNLLPAGQAVTWGATLGSLSTNTSKTDASGVAFSSISSLVPGNSTVSAKTTVSGNALTTVSFSDLPPVVNYFRGHNGYGYGYINMQCGSLQVNPHLATNLTWSVQGADRYEIDATNTLAGVVRIYSGSGNSMRIPSTIAGISGSAWALSFRLRAYNGSSYTDSITSLTFVLDCNEPSG